MRWILAACLFVATYAVVPTPTLDKAYQGGLEYLYKYDSQVLTGLPTVNDQYTGFKVKGDVRLQFIDQSGYLKTIMKLENVAIFKVHGNIGKDVLPSGPLPEHQLELITNTPQGQILLEQITKTCTFDYKNGQIDNLKVQENEPYWSINLKKGIAHVLKIHLKDRDVQYTVTEEDVLGKCESQYTVNPVRPYVRLTKVRHLDTCVAKPITNLGLFSGLPETQKKILEPTVHSEYVLYTENGRFAIKEVELKSTWILSPTQESTESVVTLTRQHMVFSEVQQIHTPLDTTRVTKPEESLIYVVPNPVLPSKYDRKTYVPEGSQSYNNNEDRFTIVDNMLTSIVQKMKTPFIENSVTQDLLQLNHLIRHFSADDFMTVVRKYTCRDETCDRKLEIILDCVPSVLTDAAPKVVINLINEKIVTGIRASLMINTLALTANPTPELIDVCMQLYKKQMMTRSTEDKMVARSLILCIGSLANRMLNMHKTIGVDNQITKPILKNIISELRTMLRSAQSTEEKLRLIKAIGNFGEPSFLPELKTICEDKSAPLRLRRCALLALTKIAHIPEVKEKVAEIVDPIFTDTKEQSNIRTAAFLVIIKTRPTYRNFEMIGQKMENEPSHQTKSIVYSTFLKLAKSHSDEPIDRQMRESARRCLKFMAPVEIMPWDTQVMSTEIYSEMIKIGGVVENLVVKSPRSILPSLLATQLKGTMFGKHIDLLETGVSMNGVENLVKRIVHWIKNDGDKTVSSILRLLNSNEEIIRGSYIAEQINNILSKLPVEDMDDKEFQALAFIKVNTHELQFITLNKDDIVELFQTQSFTSFLRSLFEGKQFRWNKYVTMMDNSLAVPSPVGAPIFVNLTIVHVHSFVGHVKVEGFESLISSMMSGSSLSLDNLKLKLKTDISTRTVVVVKMGSDLAGIHTGAANSLSINTNTPIDFELSFETNTGKLIIKENLPHEKTELIEVRSKPFTFFGLMPTELTLPKWNQEYSLERITLDNPTIDSTFTREYSLPLLVIPVTVDVESKLRYGNPRWAAKFPMIGEQEIYVTLNKQSVRCPTIVYEIDLSELPRLYECNEGISNYRTGRQSLYDYDTTSTVKVVRPDEVFVKKCPAVKIPMIITTEEKTSRNIEILATYIRSPNWLIHQLNIQLVGKSLVGLPYGFENIKMFTETLINVESLNKGQSRYPVVKFTFGFGLDRFDENKIVVKVVQNAPEHIFEGEYRTTTNQPESYKYTVIIQHNDLTKEFKNVLYTCQEYLQPLYNSYINKIAVTSVLVKRNEIKCFLKVVPQWENLFVVIDVPEGDRYMMKLPWNLPFLSPLTLNKPYSLIVPPYTQKLTQIQKLTSYGKCVLGKNTLKTYDGHTLNLPRVFFEPNCEMLLSRDCSYERSFTLTMTPTDRSGQKAIKLVVPEYKIEVIPSTQNHWYTWNKNVNFELKINDEEVTLNTHEPIVLESKTSRRQPLYVIKKVSNVVDIVCVETGLRVNFDGTVINVEPSTTSQGQLCGLCADYNMDSSNDVKYVHVSPVESMKEHFLKYIIPSPDCRAQGL